MEEKCMTCGGKLGMLGGKAVPGGRICPKCVSRLGTEIMREIQTFTAEDIKDFIAVDTSGSPLLLKYRANVRLIETEDKRIKSWDTEIASVVHFTELSGHHSVLERPLSEVNGRLFFS